jgi:hypothetical protein
MKTNLKLFFSSEGKMPSEIAAGLKELNFSTAIGLYDFAFDWADKQPTEDEILALGDKVAEKLAGSKVSFKLITE